MVGGHNTSLPLQIVASLPLQIIASLPLQIVASLPLQIVAALPLQIIASDHYLPSFTPPPLFVVQHSSNHGFVIFKHPSNLPRDPSSNTLQTGTQCLHSNQIQIRKFMVPVS
jgi:hypothetical protein